MFVPRYNLHEKWLGNTFKAHLISASSAITLGNFTDNVEELVWGELSLYDSLTAFSSPSWLTVTVVFVKNTMLEELKSLSFSWCFLFFVLCDTNADIPIFQISITFLLHWVHIAFFQSPGYFCSQFLNRSSCNQESLKLVSLRFCILIVYSDCLTNPYINKKVQFVTFIVYFVQFPFMLKDTPIPNLKLS